jgi:DNA-binding PadR family transcriptional regulator
MEEAGCVTVEKDFVDRKPRTTYKLTEVGREKFEEHIETLEQLVDQIEGS